jgi:hypothetical protein
MAGAVPSWAKPLAVAVLLAVGRWDAFAQSAEVGALAGRLTDLHSRPLDGVTVVARNQATGAESSTTTTKNGAYRFTGLVPGEYLLVAESPELGRGQVEDIAVDAGHEARVQTAMEFEPVAATPVPITLPVMVRHWIEPAAMPLSVAALAAEPLRTLPLSGRQLAAQAGESPGITATAARTAPAAVPAPAQAPAARILPETARAAAVSTSASEGVSAKGVASANAAASAPGIVATRVAPPAAGGAAPKPPPTLMTAVPAEAAGGAASGGHDGVAQGRAAVPSVAAIPGIATPGWPGKGGPSRAGVARAAVREAVVARAVVSGTASGVEAAMQFAQTVRRAALMAARESDPVSPAVTTTVGAGQLQALPLSGRRWQDFALDTPASGAPAGGAQSSLGGGGQQPSQITVDGAAKGLAFGGTGGSRQGSEGQGQDGQEKAVMAHAWAGGRGLAMGETAIREVEAVAGNAQSNAARGAGGRMNVETQRGANGLHGQAILYDRQNTWGAENPFTQWVKEAAPATLSTTPTFTAKSYTPPDRETTWGVGMGREIRRDKLFWFAALDRYQRNDPGLSTVRTQDEFFAQPSNNQMQVLSARLGLSSTNPVAEGLAAYSKLEETLAGLLGPAPRTSSQWVGFARLDWQGAERHRFTLEGIGARWNSPGGGLTRVSETYGNHSFGSSQAAEEWLLGRWEAFLTPNLLAVTQVSAGRDILSARPETPSAFEQTLLSGNAWGQLPQIVVDSRYGFTIGNPSRFGVGSYPNEHLYQAQEGVDWVRGSLLVKAGFEAGHNADSTSLLRNQTGTYSYSNLENFASDALVFAKYGLGALNFIPDNPDNDWHNCDRTGKVWQDSTGELEGGGYLPCYSHYSQTMGPTDWHLTTNDWAGYVTAQWQPNKRLVISAGLRWEREQLPPPIAALKNPELPLTAKLPSLGNNWGPRLSLALGAAESHWPVLRLGYGMYYGRTQNSTIETALTHTGSLNGDLNFFLRPTDGYNSATGSGDAPPFPYVLAGEPASVVKPGAVEFAPRFSSSEVHQAVAAVEERLPGRMEVTGEALVSLGRRLPISVDTNFDSTVNPGSITYGVVDGTGLGPIKATQITVPFYASWPAATSATGFAGRLNPDYQQITQIECRANSTYEAAMVKLVRYGRSGLTLHAHYTYSHAMDWNPNESAQAAGNDLLDPARFSLEYGTSNLDVRHSAAVMAVYEAPWKLHNLAGRVGNGWMLSGIGQFRGGLPYTMRTGDSLPKEFDTASGAAIVGLGPGMNGSGGDNRVYGVGNDHRVYNVGRNTYRYPATWKADLRLARRFNLGQMRQLELLAESFNLFNHQNVTELETTGYYLESGSLDGALPTLNFLTGLKANTTAFGQPLNVNATDFYRERQLQVGLKFRF